MINIAGLTPVEDPSYRYKMPRIVPKVEGRGNGIKTVLVNVSDVATSLNRDPLEITKFFGFELGAQTTMIVEDDRYIVNGAHSVQDLQHLVNKYIELFVLCKNCHLPETHYKIKGDSISQKCVACGSKDLCDMTHKLTTFILKQHKKTKIEKDGGKKEDKKEKKKDKKHRGDETTAATAAASTDDVDDDEKNKKKEKKSKKKKSSSAAVEEEEVIDETIEGDTERDALDAALDQFRVWLSSHSDMLDLILSSSPLKAQKLLQFLEELRSTQTLSCLSPAYRYVILFGTIFTIQCLIDHEIPRYKDILSSLILKQNQIQQRQLIAAVEWFVGIRFPSLVSRFPVVLKQLYDEDLIEEEVLIDWYHDDLRNEYSIDGSIITNEILEMLKESSKPFIIWLQEADEEGDEDEEEEEEGEGEGEEEN